ncbi:hypothetical protein NN561_014467 [Cricetulus griseus]
MSRHRAARARPGTPASRRLQHLGSKRPGPRTDRTGGRRRTNPQLGGESAPGAAQTRPRPQLCPLFAPAPEPPPQPAARASK